MAEKRPTLHEIKAECEELATRPFQSRDNAWYARWNQLTRWQEEIKAEYEAAYQPRFNAAGQYVSGKQK